MESDLTPPKVFRGSWSVKELRDRRISVHALRDIGYSPALAPSNRNCRAKVVSGSADPSRPGMHPKDSHSDLVGHLFS